MLASLTKNQDLSEVVLDGNNLASRFSQSLYFMFLKNRGLSSVSLANCQIGQEGGLKLAEGLGNS